MLPKLWKIFKPNNMLILIEYLRNIRELSSLNFNFFQIVRYISELRFDINYWKFVENQIQVAKSLTNESRLGGWVDFYIGGVVYAFIRIQKPDIVVETGVGPGSTSSVILNALHKNDKGMLYSIDLPGNDAVVYPQMGKFHHIHIPEGFEVGWLVSPQFKNRWNLIIGDAKEELPKLCDKLHHIDVFMHDSLHTDEHINFELDTISSLMRPGGVVLADDVNDYWSLAFVEFCRRKQHSFVVFRNKLGVARIGYSEGDER